MNDRKIILLIDAENTSAKYADSIIRYLEKQGIIISARIYGDFINNNNVKGWNRKAIEYEMEQKQQLTTSVGKNASDIALVIDAMDLLYQKKIDIFCIVTSDGDFTSLVRRIREDGIEVIGIGKSDASKRLGKVCDQYLDFEELEERPEKVEKQEKIQEKKTEKKSGKKLEKKAVSPKNQTAAKESNVSVKRKETKKKEGKLPSQKPKQEQKKKTEPLKNIKMTLNELVQQDENVGKYADLGGIKSRLQLQYPGFDEKDYGYKTIRELIDKETKFEVYQEGKHTYVKSRRKNMELEDVCGFVLELFPKKVIGQHEIGALGRKLRSHFPDFHYKDYGYRKLSTFLEEIGFTIY